MKKATLIIAAGLLLLLTPTTVAAGPADNSNAVEKARASFHQGVQLYNEGSFEAALAEFRKAYQLFPNYRLHYNIAQTYFDLHDYVSSMKNLKQYVQEGGSDLTAERRKQVSELNQKLEERIASLEITCNLDGADIRVDDMLVGVSPLTSAVLVNAGPRRITAIKAGYTVAARLVTVSGKEMAKVSLEFATLAKRQASAPAQSQVADNADEGTASVAIKSESAKRPPLKLGLISSAVVTGGCAIATGIFGVLTLGAKRDFNDELGKIPNTKDNVDNARTKMKNYAYLTDAFGAATLVSGGVALYFLLSDTGPKKLSGKKSSVALAPTLGGLLLHGQW
jgi:tetratricopeptide (TPR) repeat protein